MSEGEKEILVHIIAIELVLMKVFGIKKTDWNLGLKEIREKITKETEEEK